MTELVFDRAAHRYYFGRRRFPSVTDVLPRDPALDRAPLDVLERKRVLGQYVHDACRLDIAGELDDSSIDEEIGAYLHGWRCFCEDTGFRPIAELVEQPLCDELNEYAGTPDVPGFLGDILYVPDLKTLCGQPGAITALQTAGYANLIERRTKRRVRGRGALWLTPRATKPYRLITFNEPNDFPVFLAHVCTWKWREQHGLNEPARLAA